MTLKEKWALVRPWDKWCLAGITFTLFGGIMGMGSLLVSGYQFVFHHTINRQVFMMVFYPSMAVLVLGCFCLLIGIHLIRKDIKRNMAEIQNNSDIIKKAREKLEQSGVLDQYHLKAIPDPIVSDVPMKSLEQIEKDIDKAPKY